MHFNVCKLAIARNDSAEASVAICGVDIKIKFTKGRETADLKLKSQIIKKNYFLVIHSYKRKYNLQY